jgi:uncharacterized membrane protein
MDELELLKKDWNKTDNMKNVLSSKDIYPMLLKKSSSIVKTLFYISVAELVFWILINSIPYFSSEEYRTKLENMYGDGWFVTIVSIFSYAVIFIFIYLLFKAHKAISVTDNAKKLMESIIKTRKIIKYYVIYNLVMAFLSLTIGMYYSVNHDPKLTEQLSHFNDKQMVIFTVFVILFGAVFVFVIWLFYRLIYGILLRRLNKNYNELKKLEV